MTEAAITHWHVFYQWHGIFRPYWRGGVVLQANSLAFETDPEAVRTQYRYGLKTYPEIFRIGVQACTGPVFLESGFIHTPECADLHPRRDVEGTIPSTAEIIWQA